MALSKAKYPLFTLSAKGHEVLSGYSLRDATRLLCKLLNENKVAPSHGVGHALAVATHCVNAFLFTKTKFSARQKEAIILAALLHDADDKKYFATKNYDNARTILRSIGWMTQENDILEMIELVSTRSNGNYAISEYAEEVTMPAIADRVESVGKPGLARAYAYALEKGNPLFNDSTPRCKTRDELKKVATPERFARYVETGKSSTFIDHFYDKLLHIPVDEIENTYLKNKAYEGLQQMIEFILDFGKTGTIDEEYLKELVRKYIPDIPELDLSWNFQQD